VLTYLSDKLKVVSKVSAHREQLLWPFKDGLISEDLLPNSSMVNFVVFPSTFIDTISYAKKYVNFWMCLNPNGITIKQTHNGNVIF
jgi:hypothetical protein